MYKNVKWCYNKMADTIPLLKFSYGLKEQSHQYVNVDSCINLENNLNQNSNIFSSHSIKAKKDLLKNVWGNLVFIMFIFSIILSLYNKWMYSEKYFNFKFPLFSACLFLIIYDMVVDFILVIMRLFPQYQPVNKGFEMKDHLMKIIPCGMATSLEIGLSNISLRTITLSFYILKAMCKSSSLGFVLLFAFIFGLEKISISLIIIIIIITVGVVMMASTQIEFVFEGFFMAITASAFGGLKWSLVQLMSLADSISFNPFSFIYFLSPSIFFTLMLMSLLVEGLMNIVYSPFWDYGIIAFFMIISEFWLIKRTSVLTLSVAGICKEVITMGASAIFFKDRLTFINIIESPRKLNRKTTPLINTDELFPLEPYDDIEDFSKR
ncbi:unnamed protein product [Pneumocystis jirovecii]|uniref:Sugar phosphate transporter domain-containing protein n=1 Tax=Pneumocystis jirovecii TaxID=42068 RepID=L0P7A4_PNEJI|nr:unnamed protein product [Pneumocystis jirovecii]